MKEWEGTVDPDAIMAEEDDHVTPEDREKIESFRRWRKKEVREKKHLVIAIILFILVLSASLTFFLAPRVDITVRTWYREGPMGTITIGLSINSRSTVALEDGVMRVSVMNETRHVLVSNVYEDIELGEWEDQSIESTNLGWDELGGETSYSTFIINIEFVFYAGGEKHTLQKEHTTEEPYINLFYSDGYFEWML